MRLAGSLFGLAAGAVGMFSLVGGGAAAPDGERAIGFGITAIVVGGVALFGSLASRDANALWNCMPRRWRMFRGPAGHEDAKTGASESLAEWRAGRGNRADAVDSAGRSP